jgi:hypothetical protein
LTSVDCIYQVEISVFTTPGDTKFELLQLNNRKSAQILKGHQPFPFDILELRTRIICLDWHSLGRHVYLEIPEVFITRHQIPDTHHRQSCNDVPFAASVAGSAITLQNEHIRLPVIRPLR